MSVVIKEDMTKTIQKLSELIKECKFDYINSKITDQFFSQPTEEEWLSKWING